MDLTWEKPLNLDWSILISLSFWVILLITINSCSIYNINILGYITSLFIAFIFHSEAATVVTSPLPSTSSSSSSSFCCYFRCDHHSYQIINSLFPVNWSPTFWCPNNLFLRQLHVDDWAFGAGINTGSLVPHAKNTSLD